MSGLGVKPHVQKAADQINTYFPENTGIGGYRASASRDPNGHPSGLALDVMTSTAVGDKVSMWAHQNAPRLGVLYIIWKQKIWSAARASEGWRPMEDRGSPTQNHMDHVHISFESTAPGGSAAAPTPATTSGDEPSTQAGGTPSSPRPTRGTGGTTATGAGAGGVVAGAADAATDDLVRLAILAVALLTGAALITVGFARITLPARKAISDATGAAFPIAGAATDAAQAAGAKPL